MEAGNKKVLVNSVSIVLIIVVLFNVYSGITVSKVGIPGLIEIEFNNGPSENGPNNGPVNPGQDSLIVHKDPVDDPNPEPIIPSRPVLVDINGRWYGQDGSEYQIIQNGNRVSFTEYGMFGATAEGAGEYQNNRLVMEYETVFGTVGTATLDLIQNGRVLSGRADDHTSGASTVLYLTKY